MSMYCYVVMYVIMGWCGFIRVMGMFVNGYQHDIVWVRVSVSMSGLSTVNRVMTVSYGLCQWVMVNDGNGCNDDGCH